MIEIDGQFTTAKVFSDNIDVNAYEQIRTICNHPMFSSAVVRIMPDCHAGKGCVIGFTCVSSEKIVIPDLIGVDIGCGVMTTVFESEKMPDFYNLDRFIRENIPGGMQIRETPCEIISDFEKMRNNISYICDIIHNEEAADRCLKSLGTLGGGNHFIEIDRISDNRYMLCVHTGSRSLGKHICKYFQSKGNVIDERRKSALLEKHKTACSAEEHRSIQQEIEALPKVSPDMAFITGKLYDSYIECMLFAKEYAEENRQCISNAIMKFLSDTQGAISCERFDTVHNYVDWYDDSHTSVIIRKGAVSAKTGQRLSIPLNMRDGVIVATGKGVEEWNCSAPHGAGRIMSRCVAKNSITLEEYSCAMEGISTWSVSEGTIDEAPQAYKPSEEIIKNISQTVDIDFIAKTLYNFKAE